MDTIALDGQKHRAMDSAPVQLGRELDATEEHAGRGRVLELLHARAQVAGDVVAVGPREVLSRRRHHVLRLGLQLDRALAHRRRRLLGAAGDRRPVALHQRSRDDRGRNARLDKAGLAQLFREFSAAEK
jgi:hypothetical protein